MPPSLDQQAADNLLSLVEASPAHYAGSSEEGILGSDQEAAFLAAEVCEVLETHKDFLGKLAIDEAKFEAEYGSRAPLDAFRALHAAIWSFAFFQFNIFDEKIDLAAQTGIEQHPASDDVTAFRLFDCVVRASTQGQGFVLSSSAWGSVSFADAEVLSTDQYDRIVLALEAFEDDALLAPLNELAVDFSNSLDRISMVLDSFVLCSEAILAPFHQSEWFDRLLDRAPSLGDMAQQITDGLNAAFSSLPLKQRYIELLTGQLGGVANIIGRKTGSRIKMCGLWLIFFLKMRIRRC